MSAVNHGAKEHMDAPGGILPDVRTFEEHRDGHITGSRDALLQAIDKSASAAENKDTSLFVRCFGARSRQAAGMLRHMGYTTVKNIGGIAAYSGKGKR